MEKMKEHQKQVKLCAVILAVIVAVAAIASVMFISTPVSAGTADVQEEKYEISDAVTVTVKADGQQLELMTAPVTVKEFLEAHNIKLGKHDLVTPEKDQVVTDGMEIAITRIEIKKEKAEVEIPYETETVGVDTLPQGESRVVTKGEKGLDEVTYRVTYSDGVEIAREEIARENLKAPVTEVIEESTIGTIEGREYSNSFVVRAYSYTGGGRTASGLPAAEGRIAVDPRVIPLGTEVYVEGYGFAVAADTGGNIKGNTIDVYFNSINRCYSWGCRSVTIYILK